MRNSCSELCEENGFLKDLRGYHGNWMRKAEGGQIQISFSLGDLRELRAILAVLRVTCKFVVVVVEVR